MPEQLSLFDAEPRPPAVGPAAFNDALRALGSALPRHVRLGTSSWSFPGWSGLVWNRHVDAAVLAREGLSAYAKHPLFRAVGIDRTFYSTVDAAELARYASQVPDDFRFLVKAASESTSPRMKEGGAWRANAHFLDAAWAADHVVAPFVEGLAHKRGPLVFQFPPLGTAITREPGRFAARLAAFLEALPAGPWYAVELRDRALFGEAYLAALEATGVTHCLNVHPRMPEIGEQHEAAKATVRDRVVIRWMLHSGLKYEDARERYAPFGQLVDEDRPSRSTIRQILAAAGARGADALLVVNNKAEGCAPESLRRLAGELVEGAGR